MARAPLGCLVVGELQGLQGQLAGAVGLAGTECDARQAAECLHQHLTVAVLAREHGAVLEQLLSLAVAALPKGDAAVVGKLVGRRFDHRRRVRAAPSASRTNPATRAHVRATRSTPNRPKRSITAALTRFPAITTATVAVTPIRGGPTVIANTMKTLITPPSQSQAGSCSAARTPPKPRSQTSKAARPQTSETRTDNATAGA